VPPALQRKKWRRVATAAALLGPLSAAVAGGGARGVHSGFSFAVTVPSRIDGHAATALGTSTLLGCWRGTPSTSPRSCQSSQPSTAFSSPLALAAAAAGVAAATAGAAGARKEAAGTSTTSSPQAEQVTVEMKAPLDGRIGVSIQSGRRTVSSLRHEGAFAAGWRVGDVIVEVNGEATDDNEAVKAAVKRALAAHAESGSPLRFTVKRKVMPKDTSRGMMRMTPGTGGALTVPMIDLVRTLLGDFPVVLFIDGTLRAPKGNLSALAVKLLSEADIGFKAIDCSDEKYNPEVRAAVEELVGEYALPQLFAGGVRIGNGFTIEELHKAGKLVERLEMAEQMKSSAAVAASAAAAAPPPPTPSS